jgi:putative oxidoreductase
MKAKKIIFFSVLGLISLGFLFAGGGKVLAIPEAIQQNKTLHLDVWFIRLIGFFELLGVVSLWLPKFRTYAVVCLMVIMIGAIGCHIGAAQPQNVVPATLFFIILTIILVLDDNNKIILTKNY